MPQPTTRAAVLAEFRLPDDDYGLGRVAPLKHADGIWRVAFETANLGTQSIAPSVAEKLAYALRLANEPDLAIKIEYAARKAREYGF